MIHFFDACNEKMVGEGAAWPRCRHPARQPRGRDPGRPQGGGAGGADPRREGDDFGDTQLWTRVNSLDSPWVLDDLTQLVSEIGDKLEVIMVPKVEGAWDIHYVDRLLAQLEAKAGLKKPLLVHAILETSLGVVNLEEIATASPRMQGMSFGPADLAASRRMKTTRVGGGHPGYRVIEDPDPGRSRQAPRHRPAGPLALLDRAHGRRLHRRRHPAVLRSLRRHQGHPGLRDAVPGRLPARLRRRLVAAPRPDRDREEGLQPSADEVKFAKKVLEAIPDGRGVHMIDGKMQDDATWKQCKVMVSLAEMLAKKDPELAKAYELRHVTGPAGAGS